MKLANKSQIFKIWNCVVKNIFKSTNKFNKCDMLSIIIVTTILVFSTICIANVKKVRLRCHCQLRKFEVKSKAIFALDIKRFHYYTIKLSSTFSKKHNNPYKTPSPHLSLSKQRTILNHPQQPIYYVLQTGHVMATPFPQLPNQQNNNKNHHTQLTNCLEDCLLVASWGLACDISDTPSQFFFPIRDIVFANESPVVALKYVQIGPRWRRYCCKPDAIVAWPTTFRLVGGDGCLCLRYVFM